MNKNWNMTCPFCNETVQYWPNYSRDTSRDYGNVEYSVTKRGTKQFFHRSCYYDNLKKRKAEG